MLIPELESGERTLQQLHEQFVELLRAGIADDGSYGEPFGARFQITCQNRFAGRLEKLGGGLLVQNGKTRDNTSLERKALQKLFAKSMDGLDLQAARGIKGACEQRAGTRERNCSGDVAGKSPDPVAQGSIIERRPFTKIVKEAAGHFSSSGIGKGEAQDALGGMFFEKQADDTMDENMGLAAARIGRHPSGDAGVRGTALRTVG
jgi:hypothetical protein